MVKEKMGRAAEILKKMEAKKGVDYGKIHIMDGSTFEKMPVNSTGVLSLDLACGGGYPQGHLVEVSGPEGSSKTTLTLHAIAAAQAAGGLCAFVDCEHALNTEYASHLGVNMNELLLTQPDCGEQAFDVTMGFAEVMGPGDIIVVDSVAAMRPRALMESTMDDMSIAPGLHARMMSTGIPPLNKLAAKNGVSIFFTNQIRSKIGVVYGATTDATGGNALKFYAYQRFEIKARSQVKSGDEPVGIEVEVKAIKNKIAPPFRVAKTVNLFGEGLAPHVDILHLAVINKLVVKSGSWYSYKGNNIAQGIANSALALKENPELLGEIRQAILDMYIK
jgi:recombination protein RecA